MLSAIAAILIVLAIFLMSTLGSVLLVAFFMAKAALRTRITAAAIAGPSVTLVPIMLLTALDGPSGLSAFLGFSIITLVACAAIGWPVAHFATKRLDRMIQFDVETFE